MEAYDAIAIGAGHNGLVCAAYLLNAGYSVLLLEKRPVPGGAATTEEAIPEEAPGFKFNLCAIDHEFIFLGPIIEELQLNKYGLKYLSCDPHTFCPHPDGKYFLAHQDLAKTQAAIARYSERDAAKYVEFIGYWSKLMSAIAPFFNAPPQSIFGIAKGYKGKNLADILAIAGSKDKALNFIRTMITAPEDLLNEYFDTELVKAPLARLAAEIGAPPSQKGITAGLMMLAMRHHPGMARPQGGTGALTQALVRLVTAKGGKILTEQMVKEVIVEDNRAVGVRVAGGKEYRANKAVISNIDVRRLFLQLIDRDAVKPDLREKVDRRITNNNETILKIDCALSEAPKFTAYQDDNNEHLIGTVLIADSVAHVEQAHSLATMGQIPDANPSMYLDIPSVLDPTLAPEGKHTLWIEFFAPYQIAGKENTGLYGTGWTDELKNQVADNVIDKLADYAPNIKDSIIARRVESPAELGERLGSYKGNYYHLDMTLDQMIFLRPLPEIANYTTPIKNLYLTGAGTHPGGSISGMPGRNCARVFLNQQQPLVKAQQSVNSLLRSLLGINET
ncbi:beta-carotene ketolase CrtO [Pleurocapsa sp. FMAR1]|uniref:beta-carotene ketolase CrtO n=1 Tax=Pleurocapsa sp. FMAR1 TaxID=3040204 RepID=UPI0029C6CFC7|nr:NAD(P)/FAD-dependent oxidoreductase [Pleurocapsa sp. FMAR1]